MSPQKGQIGVRSWLPLHAWHGSLKEIKTFATRQLIVLLTRRQPVDAEQHQWGQQQQGQEGWPGVRLSFHALWWASSTQARAGAEAVRRGMTSSCAATAFRTLPAARPLPLRRVR